MTSPNVRAGVLKQDSRGRVRVPEQRREALLDEFEQSGASGAKFARLVGIKYGTFAGWVWQRRRQRRRAVKGPPTLPGGGDDAVVSAGPVRLFEALVEGGVADRREPLGARGLLVELPGGSRLTIESPVQLQMAAELVALLAQNARARC
jgi:transposase-like protein